jgi:hypothetical protein
MVGLTDADRKFFADNGYVVVGGLVDRRHLNAVADAVFEFLGQDPADPNSWYTGSPRPHGMVQLFQHPALWANREHPAIYQTFAELLSCRELWVSIDRANMKPPARPEHPGWGDVGFLHWDIDPRQPPDHPPSVQGVLALTDTPPHQGGFHCAPEIYRVLDDWLVQKDPALDRRAADGGPKGPDLNGIEAQPVAMSAGDLLIWNSRLPHGNSPNHGERPRLAQYIRMSPTGSEDDRRARVSDFECRRAPAAFFPSGSWPPEAGPKPRLGHLGRLLLGIDSWRKP